MRNNVRAEGLDKELVRASIVYTAEAVRGCSTTIASAAQAQSQFRPELQSARYRGNPLAIDVRRRSLAAGVRVAEWLRVRRLLNRDAYTGCDTTHAPDTRLLPRPALRVRSIRRRLFLFHALFLFDSSSKIVPPSLFLRLNCYGAGLVGDAPTLFSTGTRTSFRRRHGGVKGSLYAAEYVSPATA